MLVGLWFRIAVLPLSRKEARCVVGQFSQALQPQLGSCPFFGGLVLPYPLGLHFPSVLPPEPHLKPFALFGHDQ